MFYRTPDTSSYEPHKNAEQGFLGYLLEQKRATELAQFGALRENRDRMIPLAAANALISGVLVVACGRAMALRNGAHRLLLQAVVVSALYAIVEYFVFAPVDKAIVDAVAAFPPVGEVLPDLPADSKHASPRDIALMMPWFRGLMCAARVAVLAAIAYVFMRPNVVAIYEPSQVGQRGGE